jgi:hypothetical protein
MDTSGTRDISYENLVEDIIERFEPAKRLWSVRSRLLFWLALEVAILALVAYGAPRADLLLKLHNLQYVFELTAFITLGALGAGLALRTAIPGREVTANELTLFATVALISVMLVFSEPAAGEVRLGPFLLAGIRCVGSTALLAAVPWCALFWAVRRGMPLRTDKAGALIGAAAFSFAFAATRLGCPIDDSVHLLAWHVLPVAAATALSVAAGMAWLRRSRSGGDASHHRRTRFARA